MALIQKIDLEKAKSGYKRLRNTRTGQMTPVKQSAKTLADPHPLEDGPSKPSIQDEIRASRPKGLKAFPKYRTVNQGIKLPFIPTLGKVREND